MSDPVRRTVHVRRSPRIGVFLGIGAVLGALVAVIAVASVPADPRLPAPQALGFLILLLAPAGALLGGAIALVLEARSSRRVRTAEAERVAGEDPTEGD